MTDDDRITAWAPDLIVYHDKCADGIVAAWACWKRWGDTPEYLACNYGYQPPADVAGRNILMVDFSFPEADLRAMVAAGARSIVILDHHETAEAALEPFAIASTAVGWYDHTDIDGLLTAREWADDDAPNIIAVFDMDRSGASMAWNFTHPDAVTPRLVELAERYDLWRFTPGTRDEAELLHLALQAAPLTIRVMDNIDRELTMGHGPINRGSGIYAWRAQLIEEIASRAHLRTVAGVEGVIAVECPYSLVSAVGHYLLDKHPAAPFAAMSVTGDTYVTWSLRSDDARMAVSKVAKGQGGGGHRNAAGFRVEIEPVSDPYKLPTPALSAEAIRNAPHDPDDDYPDVRRDERERIIARLSPPAQAEASTLPGEGVEKYKAVNTILAKHFAGFIPDVVERVTVGNAACREIIAALATPPTTPATVRWRHKKRGTEYEVITVGELQMTCDMLVDGSSMVIYRGDDGRYWVRWEEEFHDGRFEKLSAA